MKIIIGILIGLGLLASGYVLAGYVQDLADGHLVNLGRQNGTTDWNGVARFEWYSDVCYVAHDFNGNNIGISCVKK